MNSIHSEKTQPEASSPEQVVNVGIDFGAVTIKLAAKREGDNRENFILLARASRGNPLAAAGELLGELQQHIGDSCSIRLMVTGSALNSGGRSDARNINEVSAAAVGARALFPESRTIIDLGGQFSKWILLDDIETHRAAVTDFSFNGRCAAGAGGFLEQQASRLNIPIAEFSRKAAAAEIGVPIAGRCSVFAKSDMIHQQQKGTPIAEIAYGTCLALARTFLTTVLKHNRLVPPVLFIGGGTANDGLIRAFVEVLKLGSPDFARCNHALHATAIGAMIAADHCKPLSMNDARAHLEHMDRQRRSCGKMALAPLSAPVPEDRDGGPEKSFIQTLSPDATRNPVPQAMATAKVHLGIDIGSVSTNVVLVDTQGNLLEQIYLPTRGNPVDALKAAFALIPTERRHAVKVISAGATGSGRHLAERLVGVDLVKNEITAQLASSVHFVPEADTIFEIGGQDAKFIRTREGRILDFEMNKICAAGTGSFLEEQAMRLGVEIKGEFSTLALSARHPVDLGSKCTVFMDAALCHALGNRTGIENICAGLAYSVARNYLEKVVAGKDIGHTIVFQGGTSQNTAVVRAFESLLNRPLRVHPHGGVSGAIGAALLSASGMTDGQTAFRGFDACTDVEVKSVVCKSCDNRCQVNRFTVGQRTVHFGDVCEKYSVRDNDTSREKPYTPTARAENWFKKRAVLLESSLTHQSTPHATKRIGLLQSTLSMAYLPFWFHFIEQLGMVPVVPASQRLSTVSESDACVHEACLPLKRAAAQVRQLIEENGVDHVLLPAVQHLPARHSGDRANTCLYTQFLPDMVKTFAGNKVLTPMVSLTGKKEHNTEAVKTLAMVLHLPEHRIRAAWQVAFQHQQLFNTAILNLGKSALNSIGNYAVVVLGKPYNLHDEHANLQLHRHLASAGLNAIPMDLLPLKDVVLPESWHMVPWSLNRDQARALQFAANRGNLFPVHISSYGCGPDAFTLKHLETAWGDRPRLFLEFDEHQGEAGLVTRIEAFRDEIDEYTKTQRVHRALSHPTPRPSITAPARKTSEKIFLPHTTPHVHVYSGILKRAGFNTEILAVPDEVSVRLGDAVTSARECHPFAIIAGDLMKLASSEKWSSGDRFFLPTTRLPCLLSQYGDGFRKVLSDAGCDGLQIFDPHPGEMARLIGAGGTVRLYEGLTVVDILIAAACYYRPFELIRGQIDAHLEQCLKRVETAIGNPGDMKDCLSECIALLQSTERHPHRPLPVVGVTGDLYSRLNSRANASLFSRLEEMGCMVWPSPFYAAAIDFELPQDARRFRQRKEYGNAIRENLSAGLLRMRRNRITSVLPAELRKWCIEPEFRVLQTLSEKYVNANTNHLIRGIVAKMADFSARNADGVISAIGVGCMVGVCAASVISAIREDYSGIPIASIPYDGKSGTSEWIMLESFVHQVKARFLRKFPRYSDVRSTQSAVPALREQERPQA